MKKTAHCIHHTHWDLIWYFTAQDATVQLCYNIKEMLEGFRSGRITDFFFDGQSAPIDEYRKLHPEDEAYIRFLVKEKKQMCIRDRNISFFLLSAIFYICSYYSFMLNGHFQTTSKVRKTDIRHQIEGGCCSLTPSLLYF